MESSGPDPERAAVCEKRRVSSLYGEVQDAGKPPDEREKERERGLSSIERLIPDLLGSRVVSRWDQRGGTRHNRGSRGPVVAQGKEEPVKFAQKMSKRPAITTFSSKKKRKGQH